MVRQVCLERQTETVLRDRSPLRALATYTLALAKQVPSARLLEGAPTVTLSVGWYPDNQAQHQTALPLWLPHAYA